MDGSRRTMLAAHPDPGRWTMPRRMLHHHVATRDDLDSLTTRGDLPHVFRPLGRDAPRLDLHGVLTPELAIWNVTSATGFESVPEHVPDVYTIRVPLSCSLVSRTPGKDYETPAGSAIILPAVELLATRFAPGARVLACAVRTQDLVSRSETLECEGAPLVRFQPTVRLDGLPLKALVHTIGQIGDHMGTAAENLAAPLLLDLLLNQILSVWPRRQPQTPDGTARAASRGIDYVEAHLAEPLTVGHVAAAAGVSVRTLQSAFRAHTGRTPLGYILERRLECVHGELMANDGRLAVSQIAYRWGFLHMGEFSRRYRERYGCLPSQTSRRAP